MSTWAAEYMIISMKHGTTGKPDTTTHTIQYQPADQAYPTGAINANQLASLSEYKPDSDGDTELAYDIYKDGIKIGRIQGPDLIGFVGA